MLSKKITLLLTCGAMMALTSDPLLSFANLSGTNNGPLTINFVGTAVTVNGSLSLPGGNGNNTGMISIGANTDLKGQSLTFSATRTTAVTTPAGTKGAFNLDPTARFDVARINVVAPSFGIGANGASNVAATLTSDAFDRLAAGHVLSLQALNGGITFFGDVVLTSVDVLGGYRDTPEGVLHVLASGGSVEAPPVGVTAPGGIDLGEVGVSTPVPAVDQWQQPGAIGTRLGPEDPGPGAPV